MTELHLGDCLDVLPTLPDDCIDLVLADPPYGATECKWDTPIVLEPLWTELERVTKARGAIVLMPVALMEYLVRTYSESGDTVLDFTMGSGTTGIACLNTDRSFVGIEIDKNYFDVAVARLEEHRGGLE